MSFGTFLACFVVLMLGHGQTCTSSMADHQNKFHGLLSGALGMSISNQEEFPQNKLVSAHESVLSSCMRLRGGGPPQSSNKPKKKRKAKSKRKTLKLKYKIKKKVTEVGPLFFDKTRNRGFPLPSHDFSLFMLDNYSHEVSLRKYLAALMPSCHR